MMAGNGTFGQVKKTNTLEQKDTSSAGKSYKSYKDISERNKKEKTTVHHIGHVENDCETDTVRIVHISDTHMSHDFYLSSNIIPPGDILVHSGDFINWSSIGILERDMTFINDFFGKLPHKHKIFVAGNHEHQLHIVHNVDLISSLLPNAIYLQDAGVTLEGITFYGSPWNTSAHMAFYSGHLKAVWRKVPPETDILVTHNPPFGIKDFGYNKCWASEGEESFCDFCTQRNPTGKQIYHSDYAHQGCMDLRNEIFQRIRPKAHLFGHVHNHNGVYFEDDILFSNGSMQCTPRPTVIDFHKPKGTAKNGTVDHLAAYLNKKLKC